MAAELVKLRYPACSAIPMPPPARTPMTVNEERHGSIPIHLLYEDDLEQWRTAQNEATRNWSAANCFKAERGKQLVVPGAQGRPAAVIVGLGRRNPREELSCWAAAAIPDRLPDGDYHLAEALPTRLATQFAFGWASGSTSSSATGVPTRSERCICARPLKPMPPKSRD